MKAMKIVERTEPRQLCIGYLFADDKDRRDVGKVIHLLDASAVECYMKPPQVREPVSGTRVMDSRFHSQ